MTMGINLRPTATLFWALLSIATLGCEAFVPPYQRALLTRRNEARRTRTSPSSSSGWSPSSSSTQRNIAASLVAEEREELVAKVLELSREIGPIGTLAPKEDQAKLLELARELAEYSDLEPAHAQLSGVFHLVYSAHSGPPSGHLIGPIYGEVTQEFLEDNETYINTVHAGPLEISLRAEKKFKDDWSNLVNFRHSTVKIWGRIIVDRDIKLDGGVWKYLFIGKVHDSDGQRKLVRIMETPSLFILEQVVSDDDTDD